jgi:hypothetical protein
MFNKSIGHLKENNMTYGEHFIFACINGLYCIKTGLMLIVHSIIPAYFSCAGINLTNRLNKVFTDDNELLSLKTRVEAFKKIVYHYRSKEDNSFKKECL